MKHYIHKKIIINLLIIISFLLMSLLATSILIYNHTLINISDAQFHLKRINEYINCVKHFNILPQYSFNQFNGSAVMTIYPYLNLIPLVLISFIFHSKLYVVLSYFIFQIFVGLIISFYSSITVSKNRYTSYLFSIIYVISNVFLGYTINLMDFGSSSAYVFFPLIIFGLIDIFNNRNNYWKLSLGMILVIFSHIPDTLIFTLLLLILIMINIRKLNLSKCLILLKSFVLTLLITSIFWLPLVALLVSNKGKIHFTNPVVPPKISLMLFVKSAFGSVDINGLGTFATIAIVLSLFYYQRFNRYLKQGYWISLIIIIFCSTLTKWIIMPSFLLHVLKNFQFMYRFLIIPIILLSYIFSTIVTKLFKHTNNWLFYTIIIIAIVLQIIGQIGFMHEYTDGSYEINKKAYYLNAPITNSKEMTFIINKRPNGTNSNGIVTRESTGADYYPNAALSKLNLINSNKVSGNHFIGNMTHVGYNSFYIKNKKNNKLLELPLLHYRGEHLHIYLNHQRSYYHVDKNDLIQLNHIHKGSYNINIQTLPNYKIVLIKSILFLIGLVWIFYKFVSSFITEDIKKK